MRRPAFHTSPRAVVRSFPSCRSISAATLIRRFEGIRSCRAREEESFLAWLFRIARNSVVDHHRRRAVRDHLPLDEKLLPTHSGPEAPVEARLTQERLRQAIPKLTDDQQQVIILRFIEGLSHAETARVLGKSEGAIKALQRRGLASLRRILEGGGSDSA